MTKKEVTDLMYNQLENIIYLESQIMNNKEFSIFKSVDEEKYIVCALNNIGESYISENLTTINECYDWINQNQR
jgi:hypothetical protein